MLKKEDFEPDMEAEDKEIPVVQPENPAQSEHFGDFIIKYMQDVENTLKLFPGSVFQKINDMFGIIYVPLERLGELEVDGVSYNSIPKCYTCMDREAAGTSGIIRLHDHPYLKLRGKDTAVAVIDTGIDYRNDIFRDAGGSRIRYLWDQTLTTLPGESRVPFGRLFTKKDLDEALLETEPVSKVPSVDTSGHGTALAGIAAGKNVPGESFTGAAPEASLIIVKVKQAKQYLRNFYLYPPDAEVFQEDDIMLALSFAMKWAEEIRMPLSVCLGIGTSQGAHLGFNALSQMVDQAAGYSRVSIAVAAGNEGNTRNHCTGIFSETEDRVVTELRIGEKEQGFTMEFWGEPPETYGISIQSPTGEILDVSSSIGPRTQELSFIFVETRVFVNYVFIERQTGYPLVYFRFFHPAAGIWKIITRTRNRRTGRFHMWLPVEGLISGETYFLEPSPYTTVTAPGDARNGITATACQYRDGSLYIGAGRGYTPDGMITPHLAAPGVDVRVPLLRGGFGNSSGTSLAAAQTAGAAALLFEWAVIRENQPFFTGSSVKYYLQRGARREENQQYPNPEWGYGKLDLYHTFELLT